MAPPVDHEPSPGAAVSGHELVELSREDCLARLAGSCFGRLAVAGTGIIPLIRPVNYRFDERSQSIVFRTREGTKLAALLRTAQAAFEVDEIEPDMRRGWSVIVTGPAEPITDPVELRRLRASGLEPWATGPVAHWMRIRARTVSGRAIGSPQQGVKHNA